MKQPKLVRDKIVEHIYKKNKDFSTMKNKVPVYVEIKNNPNLYIKSLTRKLVEEANELDEVNFKIDYDKFIEEFSDVLEVAICLKRIVDEYSHKNQYTTVHQMQLTKRECNGSFEKGIFLIGEDYECKK